MIESKHVAAVVTSRRDVSSDLWIVRIRPAERVPFTPGQYVTVGLPQGPKLVERPYSIASAPSDEELEFFIELVPGGHLSPHLYDIAPGAGILIRRLPKGRFFFDAKSGHPYHFMVATVTGIAPFLSMVRDFAEREAAGEVIPYRIAVLHAASIAREFGYCDELSRLARERSFLTYIPTVSRIWLDPSWGGELGRAEDIVRKHLDGLGFTSAETTAYACGNPNMIENVKGILQRAGFPKEFVKQEAYWVAGKEE